MANLEGSKDGSTWEEVIRKDPNSGYNRFSTRQYINNLTLLKDWCERKIIELQEKIDSGKDTQV